MVDGSFSEETTRQGRVITKRTTYASGKTFDVVHKSTEMEYRGAYREGEWYDCGDTTTYGGSCWVLMVEKSNAVPGRGNSDWRLAVKVGRDGKDGVIKTEREPEPVRLK